MMAMSQRESNETKDIGWLEASGLPHILRMLGMAVQPAKLSLAFTAIVLTILTGFSGLVF